MIKQKCSSLLSLGIVEKEESDQVGRRPEGWEIMQFKQRWKEISTVRAGKAPGS